MFRSIPVFPVLSGEVQVNSNLESIKVWLNSSIQTADKNLSHNIDDFFNYIFNSSSDGVGLIDLQLNVIGINTTMRDWYAHKDPFLGQKCYAVYHGRTSPCEGCPTLVSMRTGRMQSSIVPYESRKERFGEQGLATFPVWNEKNEVIAVIEYVRDMSKENRGRLAMNNLNSMLDSQSRKIMEQELALGLLGRQLSETITKAYYNVHEELQYQILPIMRSILQKNRDEELKNQLQTLENILVRMDANASSSDRLSGYNLTYREKQIAGYVKNGLSSKEICDILCISKKAVDFHRSNLRKKFGLAGKRIDLKSYLISGEGSDAIHK